MFFQDHFVDKRLLEHEDESTVANFKAHVSVHTGNDDGQSIVDTNSCEQI